MSRVVKIGRIGDEDPILYGGGVIFSAPGQSPWLEFFEGLEDQVDDIEEIDPREEVAEVYRVDLEESAADFLSWYDWVDWKKLGVTPSDLQTPQGRAMAIWTAALHYGWEEFDQYPLTLTIRELKRRWGLR